MTHNRVYNPSRLSPHGSHEKDYFYRHRVRFKDLDSGAQSTQSRTLQLTIQTLPGRVHVGEVIARAAADYKVKRTPFFNLREKLVFSGDTDLSHDPEIENPNHGIITEYTTVLLTPENLMSRLLLVSISFS